MRLFPTLFLLLLPALLFAAAPEAPYLRVGVDQPITVYAGPRTTATLYARPSGFTLTHITWTQVPDRINHLNTNGVATLVPHGQPLPTTAWNADRTVLTVNLGGGLTNTIRLDRTNTDHRTRLASGRDTLIRQPTSHSHSPATFQGKHNDEPLRAARRPFPAGDLRRRRQSCPRDASC